MVCTFKNDCIIINLETFRRSNFQFITHDIGESRKLSGRLWCFETTVMIIPF